MLHKIPYLLYSSYLIQDHMLLDLLTPAFTDVKDPGRFQFLPYFVRKMWTYRRVHCRIAESV